MTSTRVGRHVNAPRARVYAALVDAKAIAPVEGADRHDEPGARVRGTAGGRLPDIAHEVVEFETADPALRGEMTITITLADADGGTDVLAVHAGLPRGRPADDNEAGWREARAKLAALVEAS